jgi:carbon monoxide dehydrogenase subunit G
MQFENEFVVDAPVDQTWATLLDIRRVAQCLPGAVLESDGADGVFRGSMKVKLGPATLSYQGTARMAEVEEDAHSATIEVKAKEQKGQGTASARIQNQLSPGPQGGTKVTVLTDLNITGRPAQFGRGIMEDVAGKMLQDFAKRLETEVLGTNGSAPVPASAPAAPGAPAAPAGAPDAGADARPSPEPAEAAGLDLGAVLLGPLAKRAGIGLALAAVLALLRMAVRGRKTGLSVTVSWR